MTVAGEERGAPVPAGNNKVDLLIRSLGISDESQQIWYAKTSSLLLRILQSTGYDIHQQLQYLTLYHTQLLPWLGPYPHMWDSFLTYSGVPVEFSVNFSQKGSSMARIGWEPISHATGTPQDPFNQATVTSAISRLSSLHFKGFSPELVSHFMDTLTVSREEVPLVVNRKLPMERYKNQVALGLDLKDGDVAVKCYIYPALKAYVSGRSFQQLLDASISQMHDPAHWALSLPMVHEYLTTAGLYNDRSFIGFDCTITSKSRLKVYNTILDVSWNKVQEIWTLGGHTANQKTIQQGLDSLGTLWKLINRGKENMSVGIWSYELSPGSRVINPKWYLILQGLNDMDIAHALVEYFRSIGREEEASSYLGTLASYFPQEDPRTTTHLIHPRCTKGRVRCKQLATICYDLPPIGPDEWALCYFHEADQQAKQISLLMVKTGAS